MAVAAIAAEFGRGQGKHGPQALAARIDEMPGKLGDQLDIRSRPVEDDAVDIGHVLLDKRNQRRKTGSRIVRAGKLNHNSQWANSYIRQASVPILSALRRQGQGNPPRDADHAMKELLRSNDPVLLSYVSALLEEERIGFIVADLNMSVLEGSIGALPRRILVESDKIVQARHLLTEAGIGHVIADDQKA
jgi:hypothetical protein